MDAIVAVYADWGIGAGGTQPVALNADRMFFRRMTQKACIIVGRKTLEDFPGGRPLPNRVNLILTRQALEVEGATVVHSSEEALEAAKAHEKVMVIGGASVYRQMLPWCHRVYVTKLSAQPESDVFFPNLDLDPDWVCEGPVEEGGNENGVDYQFLLYRRRDAR